MSSIMPDLSNRQVPTLDRNMQVLSESSGKILPSKPFLDTALHKIGPIPHEALFLGCAEDELPILLNLHDPNLGPILIVGNNTSGKIDLLHVLSQFVVSTHTPREIQFAVITDQCHKWPERLFDAPHCVGIFQSQGFGAKCLVNSVAAWLAEVEKPIQSILILIDDFESILHWDNATQAHLYQVLNSGPTKRVWPIVTIKSHCNIGMQNWLPLFRQRIVARDLIDKYFSDTTGDVTSLYSSKAPWFSMIENEKWIHFWIPALGY